MTIYVILSDDFGVNSAWTSQSFAEDFLATLPTYYRIEPTELSESLPEALWYRD